MCNPASLWELLYCVPPKKPELISCYTVLYLFRILIVAQDFAMK